MVVATSDLSSLSPGSSSITIRDDDERGVSITVPGSDLGVIEVAEDGPPLSYQMSLTSRPTDTVSIAVTASDPSVVTVSPALLTFTSEEWANDQSVEVTALSDDDSSDESVILVHRVSGADYGSNDIMAPSVAVSVRDDDEVGTDPVATGEDVYVSADETVAIGVLDNDYDADDDLDSSSLMISQAPTVGTASIATTPELGPHVSYTAQPTEGTDVFVYSVCDDRGVCSTAQVNIVVGISGCTILGTEGPDIIRGTRNRDIICGLGGNDVIRGIGGNDIIVGGTGDDTIVGGGGDDTIYGGPGDDTIQGSSGYDTIWGGPGDDTIEGNGESDVIVGGGGDDTIVGGGGDDTLWGGPGHDDIDGNAGNDSIWGGLGDDVIDAGNRNDSVWGGPGADSLTGGVGADALRGGAGADRLWGNSEKDVLRGGAGNDELYGGGDQDELYGESGDDHLYGNAGDDHLDGGPGDDTLDGGWDDDDLYGGDDSDTCTRGTIIEDCE